MSLYLIKRRLIWNKEKCHSRQNNLLSVSLTTFIDKLHDSNHCYAHFQARILHERNGHGGGGHHGHGVHAGRSGLAPLDRLSSASDSHLDCTCCSCDWISKALLCRYPLHGLSDNETSVGSIPKYCELRVAIHFERICTRSVTQNVSISGARKHQILCCLLKRYLTCSS